MSMIEDFYTTRPETIKKMLVGIKINHLSNVLDIGAGKGDISDYIKETAEYYRTVNFDVIEINPDLQFILRGKKFNLVHDDFETFNTYKRYDLMIGNLPFSCGERLLKRALELLQKNGGELRCLVNAETIRNPFSMIRRDIIQTLENLGGEIEFLEDEFLHAERKTGVEVALVKASVKQTGAGSVILETLQKSQAARVEERAETGIVERNFISQILANFNMECEIGIRLIEEYFALKPLMKNRIVQPGETGYVSDIIELKVGNAYNDKPSYVNEYLEQVRHKYWSVLIGDQRFSSKYTSNIVKELNQKLDELKHFDFTLFNIRELEQDLSKKIMLGIEKSIDDVFEVLTCKYAYFDYSKNLHYYNAWKTNKAHKINRKCIVPMNGFSSWSSKLKLDDTYIHERLGDIVKVFNYLSGEQANVKQLVGESVETANQSVKFSNIDMRYFEVTFFKKGTAHIKFKDQRLLDKLNIYGSRKRGWLPPSYGKKRYDDLDDEEKAVIDDFQGKEQYEEVIEKSDFYLIEPKVLQIAASASAAFTE